MTAAEKEAFIRRVVAASTRGETTALLWSTHAIQRLVAHGLVRTDVESALAGCEVIEDYPEAHRSLPDCLVLGFDPGAQPLHAVIALDVEKERGLIVTVYRPEATRWSDDWKTRR